MKLSCIAKDWMLVHTNVLLVEKQGHRNQKEKISYSIPALHLFRLEMQKNVRQGSTFDHTTFLDRSIRSYLIIEEPGIEATAIAIDWILAFVTRLYCRPYYFFR